MTAKCQESDENMPRIRRKQGGYKAKDEICKCAENVYAAKKLICEIARKPGDREEVGIKASVVIDILADEIIRLNSLGAQVRPD